MSIGIATSLDDAASRELATVTGTDVAFVAGDTLLGASWELLGDATVAWPSAEGTNRRVRFGDGERLARAAELAPGLRIVFCRPLDRALAPFREARATLWTLGGLLLVLGFVLSNGFSRRIARPVRDLTRAADRIAGGRDVALSINGSNDCQSCQWQVRALRV